MSHEARDKLRVILGQKGYSLTKPRLKTFSLLQRADGPQTTTEIIGQLRDIDKVSVYRTLNLFSELGITHRVWNGFKSKIDLSEEFSPHHHHFTCINCGAVTVLKSDNLEASLHELERDLGFNLRQHSVELSGYCANCKHLNARDLYQLV